MKKIITIALASLLICFAVKAQPIADKNFESVLNKIINDYPNNFNNLKGKKIFDGVWKSIESLPGYENATIDSNDIFNSISWKTTIIKSVDSAEAINKYREMSGKIDPVKFDCCSLTKEETSSNLLYKIKEVVWSVGSLNPGKDNKFTPMNLRLSMQYPKSLPGEYEVTLTIEKSFLNQEEETVKTMPLAPDQKKTNEESIAVNAQHIPDKHFADAIRKTCSECIDDNNNLLPPAKTLKKLVTEREDIESVEGIEGFTSLEKMYIDINKISFLPSLPASLTILACSYNNLSKLPDLPSGLIELMCDNNKDITTIPALPASLKELWVGNTAIKSLPVLPPDLTFLSCSNTMVTTLPILPAGLKDLNIANTKITSLPPLPDALEYMSISINTFNCIPSNNTNLHVRDENIKEINVSFCKGDQKPFVTTEEKKPDADTLSKKLAETLKDLFKDDNGKKEDDSKCVTGNCTNGIGTLTFTSADGPATYKGSFKNGKFNGQGSLVVKDAYKYTGSFKDGLFDGRGTYTFVNGNVYTGEMKKGAMEGSGTIVYKNGKKSTGIWKENKFWSGTGFFIYDDKSSYYGGVKENMAAGQGIRSFTNGKTFTGTFSKGEPVNGKGYFFFAKDNTSYEGTLVNGEFSGIGIYTDPKGNKYSGNFVDGLITGAGKLTGADGGQYDGNFKDGYLDGYGVMKLKDGTVYKGNFTNNKQDGQGDLYDANGNLDYSGNWSNGKMTYPENSVSSKKNRLDYAKGIFSRVYFKGQRELNQYDLKGTVAITDEYHLNNDYTVTGTHEEAIDIGGTIYRTKSKITGSYDPVSHTIYMNEGSIIYRDKFPEGTTWRIPGTLTFDGKIYIHKSHPGYYLIEGKDDQGNKFVETDYQ